MRFGRKDLLWPAGLALACAASPVRADRLVIFTFDQILDTVIRIEDRNGDGDTLDPGEVVSFIDDTLPAAVGIENAQGLFAIGPYHVLATDNFTPENVRRLRDIDGDMSAFDDGESTSFWDGTLPGGKGTILNPVCLTRGPGDAFYLIDNNTLDIENPEAIYRLEDLNGDGDADDFGEARFYFEISPAGACCVSTTFDLEFDAAGNGYTIDISDPNDNESIDIIDPNASTRTEWVNSVDLLLLGGGAIAGTNELTYDPDLDAIIGAFGGSNLRITRLKDLNGSGTIDTAAEVTVLWSETANADGHSAGIPRDVFRVSDGSILFVDAFEDQIVRLVDANDDGDYNDLGETRVVYDAVAAAGAGQLSATLLLTAVATIAIDGDVNGDGTVNFADLLRVLSSWGPCTPCAADLDASGDVGFDDLLQVLSNWP